MKKDISFEKLDRIAYAESDTELAQKMQEAKTKLFRSSICVRYFISS